MAINDVTALIVGGVFTGDVEKKAVGAPEELLRLSVQYSLTFGSNVILYG